ncbi:MAG: copper homeostasis protein CutC [Bacteroidales bacterium]|nr:copper homeostasis protein CutC [Bacteroidales bacterium]
MRKITVEICASSLPSALAAYKGGAERIELCSALSLDGLTPTIGTIRYIKDHTNLIINALIRPREGSFVFDKAETAQMVADIRAAAEAGCSGAVVGALTPSGLIDMEVSRALVEAARECGLTVTYHRAVDYAKDTLKALESVLELAPDRILTSGGAAKAEEGIPVIRKMVEMASGRALIMAGSGVNSSNAARIVAETGAAEVHLSATIMDEVLGLKVTSSEEVSKVCASLAAICV